MDSCFEKYSKKVKDIQSIIYLNKIFCKQTPILEKYKKNIKYRHISITNIKDINQNQNINNKDNLESSNNNYISNTAIHKNSISPENDKRKILNIHAIENNKINKKHFFGNLSNINNLVDYNSIDLKQLITIIIMEILIFIIILQIYTHKIILYQIQIMKLHILFYFIKKYYKYIPI